jgi:hypothetical protein
MAFQAIDQSLEPGLLPRDSPRRSGNHMIPPSRFTRRAPASFGVLHE